MPKKIRCYCKGNPACKLCHGEGKYAYEPGSMGWQPFPCPTCEGTRLVPDPTKPERIDRCYTCNGRGSIDPANPPSGGMWDDLCKILFGA